MQTASVIVRVKDEATTIGRVFELLREQTVPVEIVVVDSGSTDGTLELARRHSDRLVEIPAETFSYGRSLNVGAEHASGTILFAVSAHCFPVDRAWVHRSIAHYERDDVAATNGLFVHPEGRPLTEPFFQTAGSVADPSWGFANHASSWRREVWQQFPFDESLDAAEDKEWAWRVLNAGWTIVYDPLLNVSRAHRRDQGLRALYARQRKEARAIASRLPGKPFDGRAAMARWWNSFPYASTRPRWMRRLGPHRTVEILAKYHGGRDARHGGTT